MGGGLIQLVATGSQDIHLTGNPDKSFFKTVYPRHTNFAMEIIKLGPNHLSSGSRTITEELSKASITIPRNGDLIHRIYVQSSTPGIINGDAIIEEVAIEIGGQILDKHTKEYLQILSELTTPTSKQEALKVSKHCYGDGYHNNPTGSENSVGTVQIPLQFWFCRNIGLALPLISLLYHEVKLNFTWGKIKDVGVAADLDIYIEYIYLDTDERRLITQTSHEYLIENIQYMKIPMNHSNILNFNHPIKELYWTISDNFQYNKANLLLNGTDRFIMMPEEYFQLQQPLVHHTSVPGTNLRRKNQGQIIYNRTYNVSSNMNSNGHLYFIDSNSFELVETEYYYSVGDVVIVSVYNNGLFVGSITTIINEVTATINNITDLGKTIHGEENNFNIKTKDEWNNSMVLTSGDLVNIDVISSASPRGNCSSLTKRINCYSFAINPEEWEPSGTLNCSRLKTIQLKFEEYSPNSELNVYGLTYNILRIISGMGGLAYGG